MTSRRPIGGVRAKVTSQVRPIYCTDQKATLALMALNCTQHGLKVIRRTKIFRQGPSSFISWAMSGWDASTGDCKPQAEGIRPKRNPKKSTLPVSPSSIVPSTERHHVDRKVRIYLAQPSHSRRGTLIVTSNIHLRRPASSCSISEQSLPAATLSLRPNLRGPVFKTSKSD